MQDTFIIRGYLSLREIICGGWRTRSQRLSLRSIIYGMGHIFFFSNHGQCHKTLVSCAKITKTSPIEGLYDGLRLCSWCLSKKGLIYNLIPFLSSCDDGKDPKTHFLCQKFNNVAHSTNRRWNNPYKGKMSWKLIFSVCAKEAPYRSRSTCSPFMPILKVQDPSMV